MEKVAVIFGGHGFIGRHLTCYLLDNEVVERVLVLDIAPLERSVCTPRMLETFTFSKVEFHQSDVRHPIALQPNGEVVLVFNLAAVHREPGHGPHEYYETNLPGAENVCHWCEKVGCNTIVCTSSDLVEPFDPISKRHFSAGDFSTLTC